MVLMKSYKRKYEHTPLYEQGHNDDPRDKKRWREEDSARLKRNKTLIIYVTIGLVVSAGVFLLSRKNNNSYSYTDIEGIVSVYPEGSKSKNYKLKADMSVKSTPKGIYGSQRTYDIDKIYWENGGSTYFEECQVIIPTNEINSCTDSVYRDWRVEVYEDTIAP